MDAGGPVLEEFVPGARRLYIVFGGIAGNVGMPPFEFYKVARILDQSKLFVRDPAQAWYQRGLPGIGPDVASIGAWLTARIAASGAQEVVFVGNSMGGFAALLFCGLLGRGTALAFAPQTFVSRAMRARHGDGRWAEQLDRVHAAPQLGEILDLRPWLAANAPGIRAVVYAPVDHPLDWAHAAHLAGLPNVAVRGVKGADHSLVRQLRDAGLLHDLLAGAGAS